MWSLEPVVTLQLSLPLDSVGSILLLPAFPLDAGGGWASQCRHRGDSPLFSSSLRVGLWRTFRRGSRPSTPWWNRKWKRSGRSTGPSGSPSWMLSKPRRGGNRTSDDSSPGLWWLWLLVSRLLANTSAPSLLHSTFVSSGMRQWEGLPWQSLCHPGCVFTQACYVLKGLYWRL